MKIKFLLLGLFLLVACTPAVWADEADPYFDGFKSIPILHEGRLKPLDTYARNLLIQFSGRDSYQGQSASRWLAKLIFTPRRAVYDKVILINDPDIPVALNIKPEEHRRYSFAELSGAYAQLRQLSDEATDIDEHQRSLAENEIIRVAENVGLYLELADEFIWAYPDKDFTITSTQAKQQLGLDAGQDQFSFMDLVERAEMIRDMGLTNKSQGQMPEDLRQVMAAVNNMFHWSQIYRNIPFDVIPSSQSHEWLSPWDAIQTDFSDDQTRRLVLFWQQMALDYQQGDLKGFDMNSRLYMRNLSLSLNPQEIKAIHKFPLELLYQQAVPFSWAKIFYILAFIFFIISFTSSNRIWYVLGAFSVLAGFIPHAMGLMARIIIMGRPPVSSLYETFIFVGFITVLFGLVIEYVNRQWLGIVTAAISGAVLLFIAGRYSAEGDTLKMLVAVLNSNFWLATHVTTITMGYGATCVAGILGHIWLLQAAFGQKKETLDKTYKTTLGMMGVALTLTFLGTNLGGIWADQSWGRFWGWDPKENGALMIVLWLALLFHAKAGQMINDKGLAVGCIMGMMVVMWAWFGVNLLSIGLHSYGFTSGIANALIAYAVIEIIFICVTLFFTRRQFPKRIL